MTGSHPPQTHDASSEVKGNQALPESRYEIVEREGSRMLVCESASNIALHIDRGVTIQPEEARKAFPQQSIFLDGYCAGPPFLDNERRQYSFDHHGGPCPRPFLLATCEQAVVVVLTGMPLDEGDWQLYLNDPDLDALLAAWVLVNHAPLRQNHAKIMFDVMPLLRVEGVIDAHGTEMSALSGLPREWWEQYSRDLEKLRAEEVALKAAGEWESVDVLTYSKRMLESFDARLFPPADRRDLDAIKEAGRASLARNKVAVLCRSTQGIYAVEERLKERFGNQLGLIVLDAGGGRVTLRKVDPFMPRGLAVLYQQLNTQDPNASESDAWGGSDDIGGSPRRAGTGLSGQKILETVADVFGEKRPWWRRLFLGRST